MEKTIKFFYFVALGINVVTSQCLNRQAGLYYNRQIPETIIETPINYPLQTQLYQPAILETQSSLPIVSPNLLSSPTTIITDCTPSVCKNLVDTIQLMAVCNLIRSKNGGTDVALKLAEPIFNELIASPYGCSSPVLSNSLFSNLVNPGVVSPISSLYPNFVGLPSTMGVASVNPNAQIGNILSMLGN